MLLDAIQNILPRVMEHAAVLQPGRDDVNSTKKIALAAVLAAMILLLAGCPQSRTIAQINQDPAHYMNKEVAITGTVTHTFGAFNQGVYEVNDGTGSIWVLSENYGVPSNGQRVGVVGTVIPTLTFAGKSFATGLHETRHRTNP